MKKVVLLILCLILQLSIALGYTVTMSIKGIDLVVTGEPGNEIQIDSKVEGVTGWSVKKGDITITDNKFIMPAEDVEVEAIFDTTEKFVLTVDTILLNREENKPAGEVITVETKYEESEYVFTNWEATGIELTEAQKISTSITFTMPWNPVTLTANYIEPAKCTITYDANDGTGATLTDRFKKEVAKNLSANTFVREGYVFVGWSTTANGEVMYQDQASYTATEDVTLYAVWTPRTYIITYNLDGGTVTGNPTSYTIETDTITLINPTKYGYTFTGWTGSNGWTANTTVTIEKGNIGSKEYTANWELNTYTVTFSKNDGSGTTDTQSFRHNVAQNLATNTFVREGYGFAGWSTTATGEVMYQDQASYTVTGDTTLYAVWIPGAYTIVYNLDGGTVTGNPTSYTIETNTITLINPTKEGYTFTGWTGSNGETPSTTVKITKGSTGNKEYTASWELNTYTITFNSNGGTGSMSNQLFVHGIQQDLELNTFTRSGYKFAGWSTTTTGSIEYTNGSAYTATGAATLYAIWEAKEYSLTISGEDNNSYYVTLNGTKITTGTYTCTVEDDVGFVVGGLVLTATVKVNETEMDSYTTPQNGSGKWENNYVLSVTGMTNIIISSTNILFYKSVTFAVGMVEDNDGEYTLTVSGENNANYYVTLNGALLTTGTYSCSAGDTVGFEIGTASLIGTSAVVEVNGTVMASYEKPENGNAKWDKTYTLSITGDTQIIISTMEILGMKHVIFGVGSMEGIREGEYTLKVAGENNASYYVTLNGALLTTGTYKCSAGDIVGFTVGTASLNGTSAAVEVNGTVMASYKKPENGNAKWDKTYTLSITGDTQIIISTMEILGMKHITFGVGSIEGSREGEYIFTVLGENDATNYVTLNGVLLTTGTYKCSAGDIVGFKVYDGLVRSASITLNGTEVASYTTDSDGKNGSWDKVYTLSIIGNSRVVISSSTVLGVKSVDFALED